MDPDACQTTTVRKTVCESVLEAGQRRPKHSVTAKGHWMGLEAGGKSEFSHCIAIPVRYSFLSITSEGIDTVNLAA
jgi:hypothetical protein